jgi:hypothetical protein
MNDDGDPFLNDPQLFEQSVQLAGDCWVSGSNLYEDCYVTSDPMPHTSLTIGSELHPTHFTLVGNGEPVVVITFDPPGVEVNPTYDWNQAAKCFWNAVYRMAGKPALFPDG